ncbi:MAG TPA: amidohydrolase family protein [Gemmatimonadaceae bacterium]|nr:amidohydrolase family protein [Gemmatimonadaceae bacterium]
MRSSVLVAMCASITGAATISAQPPSSPSSRETRIEAGQSCPAGTTEIRPRICRSPEFPAPSILDYRPVTTLVTPAHFVRAAKFPTIDYHGHPRDLIMSAEGLERLGSALDSINVRMMVAADVLTGEELKKAVAAIRASPKMKDRVRVLAGIDFRNVGPGWADKAIKQLEADIAAGAVGVGELWKGLGLNIKKPDGTLLRIDDPALDPVWQACARLRVPVFIHTADPQEFFKSTIDYTNERWLELALFPGRRYPAEQYPSFDELMTQRDEMFRRNPKTTFIAAHMGWHANDLGRLGKLLSDHPNVYTEVGAVLYDIGRQPHAAHDFFVKYQDRILFGKDSFQPEEYPYYWRVFETRDEYFDYYRHYHAFWKLYGIDLPDSVLKKVYYQNALNITPALPRASWR